MNTNTWKSEEGLTEYFSPSKMTIVGMLGIMFLLHFLLEESRTDYKQSLVFLVRRKWGEKSEGGKMELMEVESWKLKLAVRNLDPVIDFVMKCTWALRPLLIVNQRPSHTEKVSYGGKLNTVFPQDCFVTALFWMPMLDKFNSEMNRRCCSTKPCIWQIIAKKDVVSRAAFCLAFSCLRLFKLEIDKIDVLKRKHTSTGCDDSWLCYTEHI